MTVPDRTLPDAEHVVRQFEPLVRSAARHYAGRGADFEDLVQEGFLALLLLLPRCRVPEALPIFLKQGVARAVRDAAARLRRPASWIQEAEDEEDDPREIPSDQTREDLDAWMLLDAIDPEERLLVVALAAGATQTEVGTHLGISRTTVGFRLARLRRRWGVLFGASGSGEAEENGAPRGGRAPRTPALRKDSHVA